MLFVRGALGPQFATALAVVGTRQVTPYGRQATEEAFVTAVVQAGAAVISRLARGVDGIAHRVAIEHGAPTVAVLAGGVDQVYPRENLGLAARIVEHGCLVSEYPIAVPSRPDYFPRRNRILSGLARATLVVEAGSGALHTANWALEQNRDVFAVPGSVFSRQSAGTNQLIREHTARLVATPEQLCEELNLLAASPQLPLPSIPRGEPGVMREERPPELAALPDEERVLAALAVEPRHIDEISRSAGMAAGQVSALLQILELRGLARPAGPLSYVRA